MSVKASTWAWDQKGLAPHAKIALLALADAANQDGLCWPARKRLAEIMECSLDTVDRRIKALIDRGLVSVEKRRVNGRQTSNLYVLHLDAQTQDVVDRIDAALHSETDLPEPQTQAPEPQNTPSRAASSAAPNEPSLEPSIEPTRARARASLAVSGEARSGRKPKMLGEARAARKARMAEATALLATANLPRRTNESEQAEAA